MLKENRNNFHWKDGLEDVDSLPGETLADKSAMWEKLHNRLGQNPPGQVRPVWYLAAAACLFVAITMPVITADNNHTNLVKNKPALFQPGKTIAPNALPAKDQLTATIIPALKEKLEALPRHAQAKEEKSAPGDMIRKNDLTLLNSDDQKDLQEKATFLSALTDKPAETMPPIAPARGKLKVIHINELGDPIEEVPNISRYYERRSFQLKLINQDAYTNISLPSGNTGFNFFKPKIISSN